jgi:hypothetical protein
MGKEDDVKKKVASFLNVPYLVAVGANFFCKLNWAERRLAPAAAGVGVFLAGKEAGKAITGKDKANVGTKVVSAGAAVGGAKATRHAMYMKEANKHGLTPHMIVAVTKDTIFLMDYDNGAGPSKILMEFDKKDCTIKADKRGLRFHSFKIEEEEASASIEVKLGPMQKYNDMNKDCVDALEAIAARR